ncbi:MAG: hypothetical protein ABIN20_05610 [candidate division WOR-3 bacterium]
MKLEEISYKMFKENKRNLLYLSDLLLSLSSQKKSKEFNKFSDTLFKYFKDPSIVYSVIKTLERYGEPKDLKFLIEKSRKIFNTQMLYEREYLSVLLKLKDYENFWKEFLNIKNKSGFMDIFLDYLGVLDEKFVERIFKETKEYGIKEIFPIFLQEFSRRKKFDYVIEIYDLIGEKEKRDSLIVFLYKKDPINFKNFLEKNLNNCDKLNFYLKIGDYRKAYNLKEKCNDEKLKILSDLYYFIFSEKKSKAESILVNNLSKIKEEKLEIGKIYYYIGNYKISDSILKNFNYFDILLIRSKISIYLDRKEKADSLLSKAILRYPDDDEIYKALFIYYLLKFEKKEDIKLIIKINEKIENNFDFEIKEDIGEKWKNYFNLKNKVKNAEFFEIKDTLLDENLIASLYFEGYKISLQKGKKEEAKKFLKYIIDNFKDSLFFTVAQRKIRDI